MPASHEDSVWARERLARLLAEGAAQVPRQAWDPEDGSLASRVAILEIPIPFLWGIAGELNLPLDLARTWVVEAAALLETLSSLERASPPQRFAALDPCSRSLTERCLTVRWLLQERRPELTLARALLLEAKAVQKHIRYYQRIGHRRINRAREFEAAILSLAREQFGEAVEDHNRLVSIGGLQVPTMTELYRSYLPDSELAEDGSGVYGEVSSQVHPEAYSRFETRSDLSLGNRQILWGFDRDVHDEGRILGPAVAAFATATYHAWAFLGWDHRYFPQWATDIAETMNEWCRRNGCYTAV